MQFCGEWWEDILNPFVPYYRLKFRYMTEDDREVLEKDKAAVSITGESCCNFQHQIFICFMEKHVAVIIVLGSFNSLCLSDAT